jgi:hypothetical protein
MHLPGRYTTGGPVEFQPRRPHETHIRRSPAVKEGTRRRPEATPAYRRRTRGAGKCQLKRRITHDVRSRSAQNQSGAESALGKGEGARTEAEANDLNGGQKADRGGAESTVG